MTAGVIQLRWMRHHFQVPSFKLRALLLQVAKGSTTTSDIHYLFGNVNPSLDAPGIARRMQESSCSDPQVVFQLTMIETRSTDLSEEGRDS